MPLLKQLMPSCGKRKPTGLRGSQFTGITTEGVTMFADLAYVSEPDDLQKLDLYCPTGTNMPLVIFLHGGGFEGFAKKPLWGLPYNEMLAAGYAIASLNFRQNTGFEFPIPFLDVKSAVRWLRAHAAEYGLDPNRFCSYGGSSGGYLAAMLGVTNSTMEFDIGENLEYSSHVQCVVDLCGHADFLNLDADRYLEGAHVHNDATSSESKYLGGAIQDVRGLAIKASPVTYVTPKSPPFFLAHGDADLNISHRQSLRLVSALREAGCTVIFHTCQGYGHDPQLNLAPCVNDMILTFLATYL